MTPLKTNSAAAARQVCWEKLTNYFEIEPKYVNLTPDCYVATPEKLAAACDENTIGVAAVFGTTYTGAFEDVEGLDKAIGAGLRLSYASGEHFTMLTIAVQQAYAPV